MCINRKLFKTQQAAATACYRIAMTGVQRYPEPCARCNGWHLSKPEQVRKHG